MGTKILSGAKSYEEVLSPKKYDNTGKNTVVSATTLKGLLFGPRSARAEQGPNNISTKADGSG